MIDVHREVLRPARYGDGHESNRIGDDVAVRLVAERDLVRSAGTEGVGA